jgi:hypothetical protein
MDVPPFAPVKRKFAGIRQIPVVHFQAHPRDYTGLVLFWIFLPFSFLGGAPSSLRVRIVVFDLKKRQATAEENGPPFAPSKTEICRNSANSRRSFSYTSQ